MTISFYDEVRVLETTSPRELESVGCLGVVVGLSEVSETGDLFRAVHFDGLSRTVMVAVQQLEPTGRQVRPDDIYDGTSIRVTDAGHLANHVEE